MWTAAYLTKRALDCRRSPWHQMHEVEKRWGHATLNIDKFREGDAAARAAMTFDLLRRQKEFKGKYVVDIRKEFGDPNGFYFTDVFPAYLIQEGRNREEESWQIVFLLDKERKAEKIIVHKNCCDK